MTDRILMTVPARGDLLRRVLTSDEYHDLTLDERLDLATRRVTGTPFDELDEHDQGVIRTASGIGRFYCSKCREPFWVDHDPTKDGGPELCDDCAADD